MREMLGYMPVKRWLEFTREIVALRADMEARYEAALEGGQLNAARRLSDKRMEHLYNGWSLEIHAYDTV